MRRIKQAMLLFVVLSLTACESGKEAMTSPQSNPQDAKKAANPWETPASLSLFMAEKIEDSGDAAIALSDIASALAEAGDKAQALAILQQAEEIDQQFSRLRTSALRSISLALAKAGDGKRAVEVARQIEKAGGGKMDALVCVAAAQVELGDKKVALATLKQALELHQNIPDADYRAFALCRIASIQIDAGGREQALATVEQALQAAHAIKNRNKAFALSRIAFALVKAKDKERALGALNQALSAAQKIPVAFYRALALTEIASAQFRAREKERTFSTLKQALEAAQNVRDASFRASALTQIASVLIETGDKKRASATLSQATKLARKTEGRSFALRDISSLLVEAEEFTQVVEVARRIDNANSKAAVLSTIALALATEPIPDDTTENPNRRMKKSFTPQEKQLAKQLVEAIQAN